MELLPGTSSKTYWTLINTVLNEVKIPMIPPLLENGLFVTDLTEKAQIFNDYFILQCTTIDTGSEIRAEANGGAGGRSAPPPHETICRKILLSCRNFCDLND